MRVLYHGDIGQGEEMTFHLGISAPSKSYDKEVNLLFSDYSEMGLGFEQLRRDVFDGVNIGTYRLKPFENGGIKMQVPTQCDRRYIPEIAKVRHFRPIEFEEGTINNAEDLAEKTIAVLTDQTNKAFQKA